MASKPRKSAASSTQSTPQVPSSSSQVQSPMTPTRLSRIQEKQSLASLNDRLAAYIERNQQLENENVRINRKLSQSEEHTEKTVNRVTRGFDKELAEARRLVDETAKDKAKLVFEHEQLKKDFEDTRIKLDKKTKEFNSVQKQLGQLSKQVDELSREARSAGAERDRLVDERKDLDNELGRLTKDVETLRKALESETMKRVDAENKLKSKTEELTYKFQQQEEMFEEFRSRRSVEIRDEVGGQIQQEYEYKFQQSLQELRAEYENQLHANKLELEGLYDQKVGDLRNQLERLQNSSASKSDEVRELTHSITSLQSSLSSVESERSALNEQLKDLRKKINEDQARFLKMLQARDADIEVLQGEKNQLLTDYQDLMDTKVGLDNEIAMYRKLLEGEERRLSISPQGGPEVLETPSLRRTPLRSGLKRKRDLASEESSATTYETSGEAHGDIEIIEDDPEGKFVKIRNKGDKEISLSGWTLNRHTAQGDTTHKFHRSVKLDTLAEATVFSSDVQGILNEPPTTILMKSQKWFPGDNITTVLVNNSGEEMAKRETKRVTVAYSRRRMGTTTGLPAHPEELFQQEGDGQGERCTIC